MILNITDENWAEVIEDTLTVETFTALKKYIHALESSQRGFPDSVTKLVVNEAKCNMKSHEIKQLLDKPEAFSNAANVHTSFVNRKLINACLRSGNLQHCYPCNMWRLKIDGKPDIIMPKDIDRSKLDAVSDEINKFMLSEDTIPPEIYRYSQSATGLTAALEQCRKYPNTNLKRFITRNISIIFQNIICNPLVKNGEELMVGLINDKVFTDTALKRLLKEVEKVEDTQNLTVIKTYMVVGDVIKIAENGSELTEAPRIYTKMHDGRYDTTYKIKDLMTLGDNIDGITGTKLYKSDIIFTNKLQFDGLNKYSDVTFFLKYLYFCSTVYVSNTALIKYRVSDVLVKSRASNKDLDVIACFRNIEDYVNGLLGGREKTNDQWMMAVYATRDTEIKKGDRICQFRIMEKMPELDIEEVEHLNEESRGAFGSTGIN